MNPQRRQFIKQLSHFFIASSSCLTAPYLLGKNSSTKEYFISAYTDRAGQNGIALFNTFGEIISHNSISSRGHAFSVNYHKQHIYCIGRRPATTIDTFSFTGKHIAQIVAGINRHFYGHACISPDGHYLYTPENNIDTGEGVISIREVNNNLSTIREVTSGGIGPHDIKLSPDLRYIIVANGGVHTHPEFGRKKLNISSMSPSIAFIDRSTTSLQRIAKLPKNYRFNSIRHVCILKNNDVVVALQNQKRELENEALLAYYNYKQDHFFPIQLPQAIAKKFNHYLGDIVLDQSQQSIASTSPKGGIIMFMHLNSKKVWIEELSDTCGVHSYLGKHSFIITSGNGDIIQYQIDLKEDKIIKTPLQHYTNIQWDNHITSFTV